MNALDYAIKKNMSDRDAWELFISEADGLKEIANKWMYQFRQKKGNKMAYNQRNNNSYNGNRDNQNKKFNGCKRVSYVNSDGESKHMFTGWSRRKGSFLSFKAYQLTEKGAKAIAKTKGYKEYGVETDTGRLRYFYQAEIKMTGQYEVKKLTGIATYNPDKNTLFFSRFKMVADFKKGKFYTVK